MVPTLDAYVKQKLEKYLMAVGYQDHALCPPNERFGPPSLTPAEALDRGRSVVVRAHSHKPVTRNHTLMYTLICINLVCVVFRAQPIINRLMGRLVYRYWLSVLLSSGLEKRFTILFTHIILNCDTAVRMDTAQAVVALGNPVQDILTRAYPELERLPLTHPQCFVDNRKFARLTAITWRKIEATCLRIHDILELTYLSREDVVCQLRLVGEDQATQRAVRFHVFH